jgi:tRNA/tmRNA/rRNA uracil-C5-methylase (TrmA/RlmC/RlmD family)
LLEVVSPSKDRVPPACPYFGRCGGCQYQHAAYPSQLALKHKQVRDLFQRVGNLDPTIVAPVIPCPHPYAYRNRIMVRSQWDKFRQALNIGFLGAENRLVVDVTECRIAEPALNQLLLQVRAHPPPKGGIKVVLRSAPPGWEVPRDSFFQNNFSLLPKLVEVVRRSLCESGMRQFIDVYCGVGFFSLETADLVQEFVGVELDRLAIDAARRNALSRGIRNGQFVAGEAETLLPSLLRRFRPGETAVLVDPPRRGCAPQILGLLAEQQPSQVVYVSCHPATMARDLNTLCANGVFRLVKVVPLDMFPQTAHVECVADLRRIASRSKEDLSKE